MIESTDTALQQPATYQIQVRGEVSPRWLHWFDDLSVAVEPSPGGTTTVLTGSIVDQSSLRGVLNKLWDLNLRLLSVSLIDTHRSEPSGSSTHSQSLTDPPTPIQ